MTSQYKKVRINKHQYDIVGIKTSRKYNTEPMSKKEAVDALLFLDGTIDDANDHALCSSYTL